MDTITLANIIIAAFHPAPRTSNDNTAATKPNAIINGTIANIIAVKAIALGIALFTFFNINNDAEINIIAPQTINIRANIVFITLSSSVTLAYDNITTAAANAFIKIAKDNAVLILVLTLSLSIANNIAPNMPITSDIITNDFNAPFFISFD